jgi:DNA-binding transcriptional LysR family regulator
MKFTLEIRQIRAFSVLARTGSFTQAARELHITQSGVSHSIRALENETNCRLLDRLGKKVVLTQAGEQLLHHANKILQEIEIAQDALKQLGKWGSGRLRLGASATACQHIIPSVLREFKESFPEHTITIDPGDTLELVALLLRHRLDLALTLEPEKESQLEFHPLFSDELQFIVGPMHPWAQAGQVERSEIPRQNYVLYNKRSITFRLIESYFRRERITLNTVIELGSMEAAKELIKLGMGVGIAAPWIARKEIEAGSVAALPLGRRKLHRRWGITYYRGKRMNLAEETFMGLCDAACAPLRAEPQAGIQGGI